MGVVKRGTINMMNLPFRFYAPHCLLSTLSIHFQVAYAVLQNRDSFVQVPIRSYSHSD